MKEIEVPGIGIVEFPDDMSDQDISSAIRRDILPQYGAGSEMLSGLTFGFGDELRSRVTGEPVEAIRAAQGAYREESPIASTLANIAGSIPAALVPGLGAAKVLQGIGTAGALGRGAATLGTGAAYGAATGAGEAETDMGAQGAMEGGVIGAVTAPIGAAVGRGIQAIARPKQSISMKPEDRAGAIVLGSLDPQKARTQLLENMSIAELSPTLANLAGSAIRRSPEVSERAVSMLEGSRGRRAGELLDRIEAEIGAPRVTASMIEQATAQQRQRAIPLYQQAYQEAGPVSVPSDLLQRPSMQRAFNVLNNMRQERGLAPLEAGDQISLQDADLLKRALDDVAYAGKMPTSGIGPAQLADIRNTRSQFVSIVDSQAPDAYRQARSIYSGGARNQEAADMGAEAWKRGPDFVSQFMASASDAEKAAFRAGANAELQRRFSGTGDNREAYTALMNSPQARQVVDSLRVMEGPSAIPLTVARQRAQSQFEVGLTGGSQTAARRSADEQLASLEESIPEQIMNRGVASVAIGKTLQALGDRYRIGSSRTVQELGPILLNRDRQQNLDTLDRLDALKRNMERMAGGRAGAYTTGAAAGGAFLPGLLGN